MNTVFEGQEFHELLMDYRGASPVIPESAELAYRRIVDYCHAQIGKLALNNYPCACARAAHNGCSSSTPSGDSTARSL